jgi:hypothetical protein
VNERIVNSNDGSTKPGAANRRRFLKALSALGVTGLAGCGGDGDGDTPTDTPTDTAEGGNGGMTTDSPTPTDTETATPTDTETATPTEEPCSLPGEPAPLLSLDGVSDGTLNLSPNAETVSGVISNPYLFEIQNGEVTLETSGDGWEIGEVTGNTFDTLESQGSQEVEWSVTVPSVAGEEFDLTATVTYEACDGEASAEVQTSQTVLVDPYIGTEWQDLAIAPEYYENLEEGQDAPGELLGEEVTVELDLSDWADAVNFQLRFTDYWPSDGWGPLLYTGSVSADGEELYSFDPPDDDSSLIVDGGGNGEANPEGRFADANEYWVYQFDLASQLDEPADELIVTLGIANGFDIDGREGLERS